MRLAVLSLCAVPMALAVAAQGVRRAAPLDVSRLAYEKEHGVLRSLLAALDIDPRSQTLVFSKTSLQSDHIGPKTPRAIYFNADTYVGWIPGAPLIEIARLDPTRGVVFSTIRNVPTPTLAEGPKACGRCHGGRSARLFALSVRTAPSGYPRAFGREFDATPSLPFKDRWGGWYVTGTHGAQRHLGNELSLGTDETNRIDAERGANVTDLRRYLDPKPYLTPHSDLVALMVMESQLQIGNALADGDAEPLVRALLGVGEARLTAPVAGTGGFAEYYAATAPKDHRGRSLGELDLKSRLYRYGCSPQVYSRPFASLPQTVRTAVFRRLREILSGEDRSATFAHLSPDDRRATLEILTETLPGFQGDP